MPFVPDNELELAFPANMIPDELKQKLDVHGLHMRPLASTDYSRGHLNVLRSLTSADDCGASAWEERFREISRSSQSASKYFIVVVVAKDTDRLVATGTVFLEPKFLRKLASAGHIEDIAVDSSMQGKGIGKVLIAALTSLSEQSGAYKTFLDCSPENVPFYSKCGYENKGVNMAKYT